jgi:hypothetical protein
VQETSGTVRNDDEDGQSPVDPQLAEQLAAHLRLVRGPSADLAVTAARNLGTVMREVIDRLTAISAPPRVLADAADRLAGVAELLSPYDSLRRYEGVAEASGLGHDAAFFDWSPLLGLANPLAPPLQVSVEHGIVIGRGDFGIAYEGPPGCVHGGYIAAAFDEVLGLTQSLSGKVGMTGTLTVKYRRPTPLNTQLCFEGRVQDVSGRKVLTTGRLLAGELLTAEATGLFVMTSPEHFWSQLSNRDRSASDRPGQAE